MLNAKIINFEAETLIVIFLGFGWKSEKEPKQENQKQSKTIHENVWH